MRTIYLCEEDFDTSAAIVEDKKLVNFFIEKNIYAKPGNVYKGKVSKVVANMNFVFIDIGDKKPGFLSEKEYFDFSGCDFGLEQRPGSCEEGIKPQNDITGIFEKGQELIVQVIKEPYGSKGARLTTNVMLPAHYVVYCPFMRHAGISRKITDEESRLRLRAMADRIREKLGGEFGMIMRTQSEHISEEELFADVKGCHEEWLKISEGFGKKKAPSLLHAELSLPSKILREQLDERVGCVITDSRAIHEEVSRYASNVYRKPLDVKLFDGLDSMYSYYELQNQIDGLYNNIVPFKKGGYIKIDVTEALTVIDINSGKFKGVDDVEESICMINEHAAKEISRQIILRNIGGLIVVDFIDMKDEENRRRIKRVMDEQLAKSKLYFKTGEISEFGLMEITRKRDAKKAEEAFFEECPRCSGRGRVLTEESLCVNLVKKIKYKCRQEQDREITVLAPANIKKMIEEEFGAKIKEYEVKYLKRITIREGEPV